jgi:oligopeptide transport system substrate-binding protein
VRASAFVRGLRRATDPVLRSETTYHLAGIRGLARRLAGESDELEGAWASEDDGRLILELDRPDHELHLRTLQPIFSPVPSSAGPPGDAAYEAHPVGNGPFVLEGQWRIGSTARLRRREDGPGGAADPVRLVDVTVLSPGQGWEDEYRLFEAGAVDFARVPPSRLREAVTRHEPYGRFLQRDLAGVNYLLPFLSGPPMDDRRAREAVALAIDRDAIVEAVFAGRATKACSLVPPLFSDVFVPDLSPSCAHPNPVEARRLAAEAGLAPGTELVVAYNEGAGHEPWLRMVAGQLTDVLGLDVELRGMTARELVRHRTSPSARGVCRAAWACDYPTAENVLFPLLHSSCINPDEDGVAHGDNEERYVNPDVDVLLDAARRAPEEADRARLLREAEHLAIGVDLAIIPLWYRAHHRVYAAERFDGVDLDFFGNPTLTRIAACGSREEAA